MTNDQELTYLYGLSRFGIKPGLAVMEQMMEGLSHPEKKFKSIHVTGTNGKGSTCAMIESILHAAGYKTALYTSPHLYVFNERIQVAGRPITDRLLSEYVAEIRTVCEKNDIQSTFFEFTTALAFLHFSRSDIDIAVIEVGMGGRYDATNVITPLVSVITNVGLDHMEFLGSTKELIAKEKAGIIKEGVPVVTAEEDESILDIFYAEAKEKKTNLISVRDTVKTRVLSSDLGGQEVAVQLSTPSHSPLYKGEKYAISSPHMRGGEVGSLVISLPLLGSHQVKNMATAVAAVLTLPLPLQPSLKLWPASTPDSFLDALAVGIANTSWEGRLQVVSQKPLVIVDGAHNPDGTQALLDFLQSNSLPRKKHDCRNVLVFAAKKGKDISEMLATIIPLFDYVVVTEGVYMPEDADVIAQRIVGPGREVVVEKKVSSAIRRAEEMLSEDGMMLIVGSLYMIPEALKYFQDKGK